MFDVEHFVQQVLKEASRQIGGNNGILKENAILAIVTGGTAGAGEGLMSLRLLKERGYSITLVASQAAQDILGCERLAAESEADRCIWDYSQDLAAQLIHDHSRMVIPVLTANSAAKIATGCWDTFTTFLVYQALLNSWQVVAAQDAALPKQVKADAESAPLNPGLIEMLSGNINRLQKLGIILTDAVHLAELFPVKTSENVMNQSVIRESRDRETIFTGRLISEADLVKLEAGISTVSVAEGTVITPMAKDYAASKGITFKMAAREPEV